jgi:hypothetical protein
VKDRNEGKGNNILLDQAAIYPAHHAMFVFVTVSHPDEIKDPKRQGELRQHAIRNGLQKSRAKRAKSNGIFVSVEMHGDMRQLEKRTPPHTGVSLTTVPSNSLLDPFYTLCGCPERLRTLMRHRM